MYVAIGDIHGNYDELVKLMSILEYETNFQSDTFIFLGDYVDGGDRTADVVEQLRMYEAEYPHWVFLKGNHEDMLLDAVVFNSRRYWHPSQWVGQGGAATIRSYADKYFPELDAYDRALLDARDAIPPADLMWMIERPLHYQSEQFIFVHAGLMPGQTVDETEEEDKLWIRSMFYKSDYDWGKRVVFGHTHFYPPMVKKNKIGIDTLQRFNDTHIGCLSAVILDDNDPETVEFVATNREDSLKWNTYGVA